MGEQVAFPCAVISIKFAEESPNHHTSNPSRSCSNLVEDISFCFSSFSKHRPSMAVQIIHFIHPWSEHRDSGSVMTSTCEISRFDGGPMAQSYVDSRSTGKQKLGGVRRANRRFQNWSRRLACAELRIEERLYLCELPDSVTNE